MPWSISAVCVVYFDRFAGFGVEGYTHRVLFVHEHRIRLADDVRKDVGAEIARGADHVWEPHKVRAPLYHQLGILSDSIVRHKPVQIILTARPKIKVQI